MKFYVALGGIACHTLKEYARQNRDHTYYYIDADPTTGKHLSPADLFYLVPAPHYGTGAFRQIGRNATKCEIYSGKLSAFFEQLDQVPFADVTILSSSFGGFGSAAVMEILDLLEYMLFKKPEQNRAQHCRVITFTESFLAQAGFPQQLMETYKANTLETLADIASRKTQAPAHHLLLNQQTFNPSCQFFLLDAESPNPRALCPLLDMDNETLAQLDVQKRYALKPKKTAPPVFISYSTKDQAVADLLVSTLQQLDIGTWIATQNIREGSYAKQILQGIRNAKVFVVLLSKHSIASEQVKNEIDRAFARIGAGLKIVPFIIDDAELDDECAYYLCRQEFYFGQKPPIAERLRELAEKISDMLE